jgi:predicted porin
MKRTIAMLSSILLFAFANGAANAQTSVTLYGSLDQGLVRSNYRPAGQTPVQGTNTDLHNRTQMMDNSSLWGMRGKEDLGDGNYVGFSLEGGINLYNGTSGQDGRLFGRDAEIKLGNRYGELYLGYVLSPAGLQLLLAADPWYWNGNQAGMGWTIQQANYTQTNYLRTPNTIGFRSADYGGLTVQVAYAPADSGNIYGKSKDLGAAATYRNGAFFVGAGYDRSHGFENAVESDYMWDVVGGYDFGVVKPSFSYTRSLVNNVSYNSFVLAATAPAGPFGLLKAAYARLSDCACTTTKARLSRYSLGYQYNLSKRSNVYANVSKSKAKTLTAANTLEIGLATSF